MPRKKGKKLSSQDFTINDSANAPKPVGRVKKSVLAPEVPVVEKSWDEIDDDFDIVEEFNEDGTKTFVYKKKKNIPKLPPDIENQPGVIYPEIIWYFISNYISPEDVGNFARINKTTYEMTKREAFWRKLYYRHCIRNPNLPPRLRIEKSYMTYGLRQRVIRALYHTYDVFVKRVKRQADQDSRPHQLVRRRCVSVWYSKNPGYWSVYFKLKKVCLLSSIHSNKSNDFLTELSRIDANPEEDSQVLQVTCQNFYEVPPLMGMTLSSVSLLLAQGFRHHRLHLGFNSGSHNISKDILPEVSVVLDTVIKTLVYDWWHPKYPHFENKLPSNITDDESLPIMKKGFFNQ